MLTSSASNRLQKIRASTSPLGAGERPAAQRAIDMDVAVGHDLGAGADRGGDDEIGAARIDLGARAHRLGDEAGAGLRAAPGGWAAAASAIGAGSGGGRRRRAAPHWARSSPAPPRPRPRPGPARRSAPRPGSGYGGAAISLASANSAAAANSPASLQIEHHRRVQKKPRAAADLLGEVLLEGRVSQQPGAHHHDGEDRALHEIARHPRTAASRTAKM